ncbi:hypothetical protein J7K74_03980, partial [Candidatus Woesearchaeota archaeon]|nr:hypothetical protein [Candidatus Woesearchaeota archaeon]
MNSQKYFIGLIVLLLVLTSCTSQSSREFRITGFKGVEIELLRSTPPSEMIPGSGATIAIKARNLGAATTKSSDGRGMYIWWDLSP